MKFTCRPRHSMCDTKVIKIFAVHPIRIDNEMRWLETCYILKEYVWRGDIIAFKPVKFVTKDKYLEYKRCKKTKYTRVK